MKFDIHKNFNDYSLVPSINPFLLSNCRRGGATLERIPTKPGAGAADRWPLLPDHLPSAAAPPRENGYLNARSWWI